MGWETGRGESEENGLKVGTRMDGEGI